MKIGNFTIDELNDKTIVHYQRSLKDWIDILLFLIPGIAASAFIIIMYQYTHFNNWIYWVIAGVFLCFAFIKLADGFTRLTQTTTSIIVIDFVQHELIAKYPYLRKTIIKIADIEKIQLSGLNERIRSAKTTQIRTYCKLEVLSKQGAVKTILLINPKQFIRFTDKKIETEVYDVGQKIAKLLSEQIKAKYQWTGFHTISI